VERGKRADAEQPNLTIPAFLNLDIPSRRIGMMANLNGYGLGLPDPVLAP
jgi:hypothetical protein